MAKTTPTAAVAAAVAGTTAESVSLDVAAVWKVQRGRRIKEAMEKGGRNRGW